MFYQNLKLNNGIEIPPIGLGTYSSKGLEYVIPQSIDIGYRLFDTAFIYQNEVHIGQGLKAKLIHKSVKREDLFIVSKLWNTKHEPEDVVPAIKRSLLDLRLDYLDLYLMHWPCASKPTTDEYELAYAEEDDVPIEDTWRAMEECVKLGYTKSIGFSNFNSVQIEKICKIATIKPVVNQVECNPYFNQHKLIEFCKQREILIMAFSPFYAPGRRIANHHGLNLLEEGVIKELAEKYKKTVCQVVLRYLIQLGTVPIPQSDWLEHLKENLNIFDFTLTDEDVEKMKKLNENLRCTDPETSRKFKEYPFAIEF